MYVIGIILLKIVFFNENILFVSRLVSSFFWMFILPGFVLMYYWSDKLEFLERFIISVPLSAVIVSVTSYYISLIGLHAKFHPVIVPLIYIIIFTIFNWKKEVNK